MKNIKQIATASVLGLALSIAASGQVLFTLTKIAGSAPDTLTAVNNSSEVVMNAGSSSSNAVAIWSRGVGSQDLGLSGTNSAGSAIDNSGEVVGAGEPNNSGVLEAFIWRPNSGTQWLGSLGGGLSAANGINNGGAVVGLSYNGLFQQHAFLWTQSGGMQDLTPDLTSIGGATAMAINSSNEAVGYYFPNGSRNPVGFTWTQAGGAQDLGPTGTLALAINDSGTVVGQVPNARGFKRAFSWTQAGGMKELGTLGGTTSTALGINNKGWIVGTSLPNLSKGFLHGFLWTPSTGMQDLADLVPGISKNAQVYSVAVNDYGVISISTNNGLAIAIPHMTATITSSHNPSSLGQAVTFTAIVTSIVGPPPDGETVQFSVGNGPTGTGTLTNGVAQFTTSAIPVGSHFVSAIYGGDANYLASPYVAVKQVVNP